MIAGTTVIAVASVTAMGGAIGQSSSLEGGTAQDRTQYRRLVREIERLDSRYESLIDRTIDDAAETGNPVDLESQADLLNLRDERDRLKQRLEILALRHGWQVPDFDAIRDERAAGGGSAATSEKDQVFAPVAADVRARLAAEANDIGRRIALPFTPLMVTR